MFLIRFKLLEGKANPAFFGINIDDLGRNNVSNLKLANRGLNLLSAHFRNMGQSFNPLLQFNKKTKVRDIRYSTRNLVPYLISFRNRLPRIFLELLDPKRKSLTLFVYIKDNRLDYVTFLVQFRWVFDTLGP